MNCQLRSLGVVFIAGLLLSFTTSAEAQPVVDLPVYQTVTPPVNESATFQPGAQPVNERILVVDISSGRGSEHQLARELGDHLRRSGLTLLDGTPVDPSRACETPQCLEDLARRDNAGLILYAQVQESTAGSFAITMALFDVARRTSFKEKAECSQCNQALLSYKINDTADMLIGQCREARLGTPAQNQNSNAPASQNPNSPNPNSPNPDNQPTVKNNNTLTAKPLAPIRSRGFFEKLSTNRKIIAGVLGGLAGAALITSVILTATNGLETSLGCEMRTDVLQDKCILKNKPLYASGYVLTGALAVGIGFTLFWPSKSPKPTAPEVR